MNRKLAPNVSAVGKNILRNNTNIVKGKEQPDFPFRQVLKPDGIADNIYVRSEDLIQRVIWNSHDRNRVVV